MAALARARQAPAWAKTIARYRGLLAPIGLMALLIVVLVPLPPVLLDLLITINIALAIITLITTLYIDDALDFSVFPSLLLAATMFRLVINIASTRLILSADASGPQDAIGVAGKVISAFGTFVAGDSLVVGLIIFLILVIVQFVVITKGATRIGEVAARFTLDAMPGKQMAIDADLNAGIIDEREAKARREKISDEADFFGAMDGAGKFVRGDAIAGIIITVINILGGFTVGMLMKGWGFVETAEVFTKLTMGDGLVSQLPSFLMALAAALVVTRASAKASLGEEFAGQLTARPIALAIASGFLILLAMTPLPALPLLGLAGVLMLIAFFMTGQTLADAEAKRAQASQERQAKPEPPAVEKMLKVDALELEVGFGLVPLVDAGQGGDLLDRIASVRRQLAAEMGVVMPPVRIRDNMSLDASSYRVKIRGNDVAEGAVFPNRLLAMDAGVASGPIAGTKTVEPAFGLDAYWIEKAQKDQAEAMNYTVVDPSSVLATHITEIAKNHADELLTRDEVANLLEQLKEKAPKLVEETVPGIVKTGELQKVLQNLLRERVPVRDLEVILETLADWASKSKDLDVLTEYVRNALRRTICGQYAVPIEDSAGAQRRYRLACVTLDPAFEDWINGYVDRSGGATVLSMPATAANQAVERVSAALQPLMAAGHQPVVIASPQVRGIVRQILEPHLPAAAVLGYNEIVSEVEIESMGLVTQREESAVAG
jgi:flagellar biosynthesis protein FlhA